VNALIKAGAPLDSQNVNGATALIYAASAGKTAIVRLLLDAGADTTLETLDGFTALDVAATRACLEMLRDRTREPLAA
jgi:thiosulfate/3-mercaptopyruvate sulfurtransferase